MDKNGGKPLVLKQTAKQKAAARKKEAGGPGGPGNTGGSLSAPQPADKPVLPTQKAVSMVGMHLQSARNLATKGVKLISRVSACILPPSPCKITPFLVYCNVLNTNNRALMELKLKN